MFDLNKKVYGYRRVTKYLKEEYGMVINHKKVQRIMKKYGIKPSYVNLFENNHNGKKEEKAREDFFKGDWTKPGWVTDISTLQLVRNGKKFFICVILDLKTRNWVSYKIYDHQRNELVIDTLNAAIKKTKDPSGIVLHSDRGSQYLSTEYRIICASNGILISHSRPHRPKDNAVIESFFSSMKKETLYNNDITTLQEYVQLVHEWMFFYNTTRLRIKK